jgi:Flp pilus assembly protein TadD
MTDGTLTDAAPEGSYAQPHPYGVDDWSHFFGRDDEALAVAALWQAKRLTVLYGESGIGKTSLVQAGVMHLLSQQNSDLLPVGNLSRRCPFSAAPLFEYNPFTLAVLSSWAPLETPVVLSTMTLSDFIRRHERMALTSNTLAVIDQAEHLFCGPTTMQQYRKEFLDDLAETLHDHPRLHVLLIIRDSYLQALLSDNFLSPDARVQLQGLEQKAAINVVRHSLDSADRLAASSGAAELAEELIDELLNAQITDSYGSQVTLREHSVHPAYLQEVIRRLRHEPLANMTVITKTRLQRFLKVDEWLAEFICRSVISVSRYFERDPERLCIWLAHAFVSAEGSTASVNDDHGVAAGMPTSILLSLESHYVLRSELRSGSRWFELQSVRLVRAAQLAAEIISIFIRAAGPPNFADYLADALTAFSNGELERAERHAQSALQASSEASRLDLAQVETLLGNIFYKYADTKQARYHYLNAAKLFEVMQNQPAVGRLLAAIGRLYLLELDATTAAKILRSALDRAPGEDFVRMELARAFAASGDGSAAVALLDAVLASGDDRYVGDARLLRGEIGADFERADFGDADALSDLERAQRSKTPSARAAHAVILARLGRFADAEEGIEQALDMAADSGPVLLRAAQIRAFRGDRQGAARLAKKAVKATEVPLTPHQRQQANQLQKKRPS